MSNLIRSDQITDANSVIGDIVKLEDVGSGTPGLPATDSRQLSPFVGATGMAPGVAGVVPAPIVGYQGRLLHGDGTWKPPGLIPAPRFYRVTTDISTTSTTFVTMFSGTFTLTADELNLVILTTIAVTTSNSNRNVGLRVVLNGTPLAAGGDRTGAAGIPIGAALLAQGIGVVGSNTVTVQWRVNAKTLRCNVASNPDGEHASLAIWSAAPP